MCAELVHSLFYTLKPEGCVISRYVFNEVQVNSVYCEPFLFNFFWKLYHAFKNATDFFGTILMSIVRNAKRQTKLPQFVFRLMQLQCLKHVAFVFNINVKEKWSNIQFLFLRWSLKQRIRKYISNNIFCMKAVAITNTKI